MAESGRQDCLALPKWGFAHDCVPARQSKKRKIYPQNVLIKKRMSGGLQRFLTMISVDAFTYAIFRLRRGVRLDYCNKIGALS
jgi:hypothetical protein